MNFLRFVFILWFSGILSHPMAGQISDNFSDGNFDQNPVWTGDAAQFKVNTAFELQLNATAAGQSVLWTSGNMPDSSIWEFDVRLTFDPSGQNQVRIYLQADKTDLTQANGYYLEMGETGSADAIRFFRLDNGVKTQLATGIPGLAASLPNLHFYIKRTKTGDWTVEAGTVGSALQTQFTLSENTWPGGVNQYFGFHCIYTISNATRFYLDNVNIRPDVPDTQAPVLLQASAAQATQVTAVFDEPLDVVSAQDVQHYTISNGIGSPQSASLQADLKTVILNLSQALNTGNYTLQTNGIKDLPGNESALQTQSFQYVKVEAATEFNLLINEIMADPSPGVGLPEVEWLEVVNRSAKIIDLSTIFFSDATSGPSALPAYLIQPGEYVTLTSQVNLSTLQPAVNGTVLGLGVSASVLNNDSDIISITNAAGDVIDRVGYNILWHTDPGKDDGGFSLERINLNLPCLGAENWQSSPAIIGGTPGAVNASASSQPDTTQPRVFKVFPESAQQILVQFTEGMDASSVTDAAAYQLFPSVAIASAELLPNDRSTVKLDLASSLQPSTLYLLTVDNSVLDCSGNTYLLTDSLYLGISEKPEPHDIVINEVLSNPATGGARYVELFNRSNKIFDWSEFFLASNSDSSTSVVQIFQERLFLPGEYHVFSNDAEYIREHYANIVKKNVLHNQLPSLDDRTDSIKIYWAGNGQTVVVDSFFYYQGLHNALLSTGEQEGVALERLRVTGPTQDPSNWSSASPRITGAYGTPTLPNSQALNELRPEEDLISLPLSRFSPDGDGREDFLEIYYQLPREGYAAGLKIFDSDGNPVKTLVRNNLIGTTGSVRWDGDTDNGQKTRPGIHVLYVELFAPDGTVKRIKKAVSVLGSF
ncbi:MAG TPA: lamin tail domain-containing protein [Saprospiraceae bacterium]|nr:lamin tail domain-containing protein [Saprospiraceae bacterium]